MNVRSAGVSVGHGRLAEEIPVVLVGSHIQVHIEIHCHIPHFVLLPTRGAGSAYVVVGKRAWSSCSSLSGAQPPRNARSGPRSTHVYRKLGCTHK